MSWKWHARVPYLPASIGKCRLQELRRRIDHWIENVTSVEDQEKRLCENDFELAGLCTDPPVMLNTNLEDKLSAGIDARRKRKAEAEAVVTEVATESNSANCL